MYKRQLILYHQTEMLACALPLLLKESKCCLSGLAFYRLHRALCTGADGQQGKHNPLHPTSCWSQSICAIRVHAVILVFQWLRDDLHVHVESFVRAFVVAVAAAAAG